jgi:ATP-dependent Zn protease
MMACVASGSRLERVVRKLEVGVVHLRVGVGELSSGVHKLFKEAKQLAPGIIFIDEIEEFGKKRESGSRMGSENHERETILNQLLMKMDGIKTDQNFIVFAATIGPNFFRMTSKL